MKKECENSWFYYIENLFDLYCYVPAITMAWALSVTPVRPSVRKYFTYVPIVFPENKWPPFFANYSLMVILIEIWIREMNLDIDHVIELFFST